MKTTTMAGRADPSIGGKISIPSRPQPFLARLAPYHARNIRPAGLYLTSKKDLSKSAA